MEVSSSDEELTHKFSGQSVVGILKLVPLSILLDVQIIVLKEQKDILSILVMTLQLLGDLQIIYCVCLISHTCHQQR